MANINILIKKNNGTGWDNIYPITTATNVVTVGGLSVEEKLSQKLEEHPSIPMGANTTSNGSPAVGGTFTMIDTITRDEDGHVTAINTKTVTLPSQTSITGNAATATKLATARTIALTSGATGTATSFDGSANISITVTALDATKLAGTATINTTGNAATATKLATARTIALSGGATGSGTFDGSGNLTIATTVVDDGHNHIISNIDNLQATLDAKTPFATIVGTTAATLGWYRIATSAVNIGSNSGMFKLEFSGTGAKGRCLFIASCHDGSAAGSAINQLGFSTTNGALGLTKVRVVYHTTATANYAYLEVYNPTALAITYTVDVIDSTGWSLVSPATAGSIPAGYTNEELILDTGVVSMEDVVAYRQLSSKIATGTAPIIVASTTKVANLNVDLLDDMHASTSSNANTIVARDASGNFSAGIITASLTGNASSATKLATARTLSFTGDATGTGSFDGTANLATALTLAASGVTAGTYRSVTVDAKGRVTAGTNPTTIAGYGITDAVNKTGDTMTGYLTLNNIPTQSMHAATKGYVDTMAQGLDAKKSVRAATTADLSVRLSTSMTITLSSASNSATIDGVILEIGDRVLVKNQTTGTQNGIYVFTSASPYMAMYDILLTRSDDAGTTLNMTSGLFTFVEEGTVNADSGWVLTTNGTITPGTTALTFVQFSGAGQITAGTGLIKNGNTLSLGTSGVTAGTYRSVTVDVYGRVTAGTNPTTVSGYGITDAITTADVVTAATANKILKLDASGLLPASVTGNSATATKLATVRTIAISGGATGTATNFDGTANIAINVTALDATKLAGTATINTTGNAATATKLATARTIALTGRITGSGTFDGSGNLSISTALSETTWDAAIGFDYWPSVAPYEQFVSVPGMTSDVVPLAYPIYSSNTNAAISEKNAWQLIDKIETLADGILCTCFERTPDVSLNIRLRRI